mmetsp:Transcript_10090/g.40917  ORF Transcript_10090/g.40917 Transcript_10090/m.40917 type:complete len:250 (-) Transcript_10090:1246-1995(-)
MTAELPSRRSGHHGAAVHLGTTSVPRAWSPWSFATTRVMSALGGCSQLLAPAHDTEKVSTASAPGHHQRELKRASSALWWPAKRSTSCGPQRVSRPSKTSRRTEKLNGSATLDISSAHVFIDRGTQTTRRLTSKSCAARSMSRNARCNARPLSSSRVCEPPFSKICMNDNESVRRSTTRLSTASRPTPVRTPRAPRISRHVEPRRISAAVNAPRTSRQRALVRWGASTTPPPKAKSEASVASTTCVVGR